MQTAHSIDITGHDRTWSNPSVSPPSLQDRAGYYQARFVATLLSLLVLTGLLGGIVPSLFLLTKPLDHGFLWIQFGIVFELTLLLWLSHTRYNNLAALLVVFMLSGVILGASNAISHDKRSEFIPYLLVPALLSSMLFGILHTALLVGMQIVSVVIIYNFKSEQLLNDGFPFLVITQALILAVNAFVRMVQTKWRESLEASEARYRTLAELTHDFAYSFSIEGDQLQDCDWITPAFTHITGDQVEVPQDYSAWLDLIHPADRALVKEHMHHRAQGEQTIVEYRLITSDDQTCWLRDHGRGVRAAAGSPVTNVYGAVEDISKARELAEQRHEQQRLLTTVTDHLLDGVLYKDSKGRIELLNTAAVTLLGHSSKDELRGKTNAEIYPPDLAAQQSHEDQNVLQYGVPFVQETDRLVGSNAERRSLLITKLPIHETAEHVIGLVEIIHDMTAQKEADAWRQQMLSRLDLLHTLDQSILAALRIEEIAQIALEGFSSLTGCHCARIITFDDDQRGGQVLAGTGAIESGLAPCATIPKRALHAVNSDLTQPIWLPDVTDCAELARFVQHDQNDCATFGRTPLIVDERILGVMVYSFTAVPENHEAVSEIAGKLATQVAIALQHLEMRQQIEEHTRLLEERVEERTAALSRTTARLEAILNNSSDGIALAYGDGTITQANPALNRLFGYAKEELLPATIMSLVSEQDANQLVLAMMQVVEHQQIVCLEVEGCRKDGSTFFVQIGLAPLVDTLTQRCIVVCNFHDITARKQAKVELENALEQEKEMNELKSRFVLMTSHEFRIPLTTILSSVDLLECYRDRMNDDTRQEHFGKIRSATRYMTELLEDVLLYGRSEAWQLPMNPALADLDVLVQEILAPFESKQTDKHELVVECELNQAPIMIDANLLRHVISNLVSNAIKYSPNGGPVSLTIQAKYDTLNICVSDYGIGIPEKDLKYTFHPFHRASNVGTIKGTGLGLAIVQRLVEMQGGIVECDSVLGEGTTVRVRLPLQAGSPLRKRG